MTAPTENWWRYTTTALAGVLMTLASMWASGAVGASPYTADRKAIFSSLDRNTTAIDRLLTENKALIRQMAELVGELRASRSHK